ncbi:MAG: hypothetical protein J5527_08740 [Treponema sp.]|nr:hypothetical protein [Treponema sp.]
MINRRKSIQLIVLVLLFGLYSATVSAQVPSFSEKIRIPLWAELDAYPGLEEAKDLEGYEYPVQEIKKIAPFLISGMVYGWEFVYVPYDKSRGIEEYFEVKEINPAGKITYSSPWIDDTYLRCWCEYTRTKAEVQNYKAWASITHPVIRGRGYGSVRDGFEGIKDAAADSLKSAVREYYRGITKNKPREITGSVLIKNEPILGIDSGRYAINLDFFLECDTIKKYGIY